MMTVSCADDFGISLAEGKEPGQYKSVNAKPMFPNSTNDKSVCYAGKLTKIRIGVADCHI